MGSHAPGAPRRGRNEGSIYKDEARSPTRMWCTPRCCTMPSRTTPGRSRPAGCLAELARNFGERTAELGAAVTNPEWEPRRNEHKQYRDHVIASLLASPWTRLIKTQDFTDNAVGIIHITGPKLSKLARKYSPLAPPLGELILRPDTPLDADVKDMIAAQLDAAQARFTAIGHGRDADSGTSQAPSSAPGSS
jgi:hypothetical protein